MGMRSHRPNRKKIAYERIKILFAQAENFYHNENPEWSDRCVEHAGKIAMRHRVRIPREFRRRYCRKCHSFLVPGSNMRVRIQRGKVIVTCNVCGHQRRYPVVKPYQK